MKQELLALLEPIANHIQTLDVPASSAVGRLNERFAVDGPEMQKIAELFARGVADGWLCDREGGPNLSYSRVRKAADAKQLSIDAVRMSGKGPGHTHPGGEYDLCFAVDGEPTFDGNPPGWTVYPPGSWHEPTVAGGTMNILYFLPGGAIEFGPAR